MAMSRGIAFYHLFPCLKLSSTVLDQMAFVTSLGTRTYCQHCRKPDHLNDHCFDLHPELKQQFFQNCGGGRGGGSGGGRGRDTPPTGAITELHLGLAPSSSSFDPMAAIVGGTPTALYGPPSFPGPATELFAEDDSIPSHPFPILESPPPKDLEFHSPPSPSGSVPLIVTTDPSQVYSRRLRAQDPLSASSPKSGISSPLIFDIPISVIPHMFVVPLPFSSFK
ncbi:hypothetical protein Acr_21g0001330 [Actinidia rufa]|uniref:Uncharacterized protein n=1 Tax=Actinidia rufa TaxID=165716 RepID=A0A7J0GFH5_9ERIC|nr:hypothetical protein Acr_21g0001330 [Actinidia rufa]